MKTVKNASVGVETVSGFVDWEDDKSPYGLSGGVRTWEQPRYSEEAIARGRALRIARVDRDMSLRQAANALHITVVELCDLERGSRRGETLADDEEIDNFYASRPVVIRERKVLNLDAIMKAEK